MEEFKIIDNINITMVRALKEMIPKCTKCLYCGIGYFFDSGYKNISDEIINVANKGSDVKILAGNIFMHKENSIMINPDLDVETYKLLINIYDNYKGKINLKSIKSQFFHGKFFLGIGDEEAYLIIGSSNISHRAMTSHGNIEYNCFIKEKINSNMIDRNKEWFLNLWEHVAISLEDEDIEEFQFLINKKMFDVDVKENIYEEGSSQIKNEIEIQCEIIDKILKNIGINTVQQVMQNRQLPCDLFVKAVRFLYVNKNKYHMENILSYLDAFSQFAKKQRSEIIKEFQETLEKTTLKKYYYDINEAILKKPITRNHKPSYCDFINDVFDIFCVYYEQYYNKAYNKYSGTITKTNPTLNTNIATDKTKLFMSPMKISDNRAEFLLESIRQIRGSFDDDWLFQYQSYDVNDLLNKYNFFEKGAYIAHEAGMGKSPIMCKFLKEVYRRDQNVRTIIAVPSSLKIQWEKDNLFNDFGIQSQIVDNKTLQEEGKNIWLNRKIIVVSIDYLKNCINNESNDFIKQMSPDILIVDEAHLLKNSKSKRYTNIKKLNTKFVLLASATPLQNEVKEFLAQLQLIDDFVDLERDSDFEYVKALKDKYLTRRTRAHDLAEIKTIQQAVREVERKYIEPTDIIDKSFLSVYNELETRLKNGELYYYKFLGEINNNNRKYNNINSMASFVLLQQLSSSYSACVQGLTNLKGKILKVLGNNLDKLKEDSVTEYDTKEELEILNSIDENVILNESQIDALKHDLEFIDEYINEENGKFYNNRMEIKRNPKEIFFQTFISTIKDGQVIVFVKYIKTGEALEKILKESRITAKFFNGNLTIDEKDRIVQDFRENKIKVFIATDAANAGLNLQNANTLINYDLNWNPQIVEQRIGRIHRIGQKSSKVRIYNFILKDTVDGRVEEIMRIKEEIFTRLFKTSDDILGTIANLYMNECLNESEIDKLEISDVENDKFQSLLEENISTTNKLNDDYYYMIDALKNLLMWILGKYKIDYYTEDEEEYYLRLITGETYLFKLNQVYNMLENEQEFFKDFNCSTPITNKKYKELSPIIEGFYFGKEIQSNKEIEQNLKNYNYSENILNELDDIIKDAMNKTLLILTLKAEYKIEVKGEEFIKHENETILITPNNNICSNADILRLFYVNPTNFDGTVRIDDTNDGNKYVYIYNELLRDYLVGKKQKEINNKDVSIKDVSYSIYNGTIINVVK